MFTVYHSNHPEYFKNLLISIMSDQLLSDPMQSEIIIIENKILSEWIQIELAKYFGISANIIFLDLISFIKKISYKFLPNNFVINDFNCSVIYWKFMEILPKICLKKNFSIIKDYLHNDIHQRKCGQLSEKLVKLFIKYLIYRPDWLNSWQSNKIVHDITDIHQLWQSELWCMLLKHLKYNDIFIYENINYLQNCKNFFKNIQKINNDFLPNRIFIFGITSIPSIYWEILYFLSYHIDIYLWFISPYNKFNYNKFVQQNLLNLNLSHKYTTFNVINVSRSLFAIELNNDAIISNTIRDSSITYKLKNILLDFCGFIGENTLFSLSKFRNLLEKKIFVIPKENSLLQILQKNILEFQEHIVIDENTCGIETLQNHKRYVLRLEDKSVTVHVCYNIYREIEILHDNLLLMLQDNPLLLQQGVIVMAPNICNYTAAIKVVFNNIYNRNLPFIISNNYDTHTHPIILNFLNILNISYNRCTSEEILSFLKLSLIADKFNITEEAVKLLHQWTIESGIRWGLDDVTLSNLNLPITRQNTWYFGLTRMLLGYAIHDEFSVWENICSYDGIHAEHISIIAQLGDFLKILRKWRDRFNQSYTLIEWMPYINEIIDDFFYCSNTNVEANKILSLLKNYWKNILEPGIKSGYSEVINIIVLRDKLYRILHKKRIRYKFLPNVINFCDITPICCIPCKVVCFLGMNEDIFPRNNIPLDFDLLEKNPYYNDNNVYYKDCYSFLLAFLLAQERLYISFIGNLIYDHTTINGASVLIQILFKYISQYFYLIEDKNLDIYTNIDRICNHLCYKYNQFAFASENFIANSKIQSFANEWISSTHVDINIDNVSYINFITPLPHLVRNTISFYDLYNFYRHPIKTWFYQRLGVYFHQNMYKLCDNNSESFSINALNRFNLNTKLVNCFIHNDNVNDLYNSICASGVLPYGAFGELYWQKQSSKMIILATQIKAFYLSKKFNLDIALVFDNILLTGQLTMVQDNGLVRWKSAYLSMKDGLLLWLEHLVYCALGGTGDSRLFGINDMWHFPNLSKFQAKEFLFLLISGYLKGINVPLLLLYRSGAAWMNQVFDWNTKIISMELSFQKIARCKLINAWQGIKYSLIKGEYYDPYLRILMPYDLSEENIENIAKTAEHYFLLPMQYRVFNKK